MILEVSEIEWRKSAVGYTTGDSSSSASKEGHTDNMEDVFELIVVPYFNLELVAEQQ